MQKRTSYLFADIKCIQDIYKWDKKGEYSFLSKLLLILFYVKLELSQLLSISKIIFIYKINNF